MHRQSSLLFPAMVLIAIVLGGSLYLFGGSWFESSSNTQDSRAGFATVAEGTDALGVSQRANYRIRTAEEFQTLWQYMFNGEGSPMPVVDFAQEEVLAVFNGSHSTTGYRVRVTKVEDKNGVRHITIERIEPGETCPVVSQITSPYSIVRVPASPLPIERTELIVEDSCR